MRKWYWRAWLARSPVIQILRKYPIIFLLLAIFYIFKVNTVAETLPFY